MNIDQIAAEVYRRLVPQLTQPKVSIYVLPGGQKPEQQTDEAIGYDCRIRAIVDPVEKEQPENIFRRTLFDFGGPCGDPKLPGEVVWLSGENEGEEGGYAYRMQPGESVLVGVGFATAMIYPWGYWLSPRSGLSSRYGITVTNAPGTVDPDFRGEAGVLVYNRNNHSFDLRHGMRIAQLIFFRAGVPQFDDVAEWAQLPPSGRSVDGFGATGLYDNLLREKEG